MKIIDELKSQKETLKMAKDFAELDKSEPSLVEKILGFVSFVLLYGVGIGFGVYLFVGFFTH